MSLLRLESSPKTNSRWALSQLGFRPFFLLASLFALFGMMVWMALYLWAWQGLPGRYPPMSWHAHEMIFGYTVAVVAGFLLTAVRNWTGVQTLHGWPLLLLASLWLIARLLPFTTLPFALLALIDLSFMLLLLLSVVWPIIQVRQWTQIGIISKLALLCLANTVFYLGLLGIWPLGLSLGIYAGFYLIIALILTIGRRIIPFFIERGIGVPFQARNHVWVDHGSLVLLLLFLLAELFFIATRHPSALWLVTVLAALQVLLHSWRLWAWYHPAIWKKPLLWVLYVAYTWLVLGFLLKALTPFLGLSPWLALHAFAYGGMGMITAGMMARVSLGHTGRNVFAPPILLTPMFLLLLLGAVIRVLVDALFPASHWTWVMLSQLLWIAAFILFVAIYLPMLSQARIDGQYG
ncbi:MAG: NnrS family protein [Proteobacteria bacterium]|nr:MAG: NnrS family protein [Pseudomonadota bacterium]